MSWKLNAKMRNINNKKMLYKRGTENMECSRDIALS